MNIIEFCKKLLKKLKKENINKEPHHTNSKDDKKK